MTSQTRTYRFSWRRTIAGAVSGGALAVGLLAGSGAPAAWADDTDTTTQAEAPPTTAEQVLAIIESEYDTGAGGGQVSNLIHEVMKLRAMGFYPSPANKQAIVAALDYRPNEGPLVKALQETVAYQRKIQAQMAAMGSQQNPLVLGTSQLPQGQAPAPANPGTAGATVSQPAG